MKEKYLFMEVHFVDLSEDPAHTAIATAHQNTEHIKLVEQTQTINKHCIMMRGTTHCFPILYVFSWLLHIATKHEEFQIENYYNY